MKGQSPVAKRVKSRPSELGLPVPAWAIELLRARRVMLGAFEEPVFLDSRGGWRDPSNVGPVSRRATGAGFL
jgi:hypothetical protein